MNQQGKTQTEGEMSLAEMRARVIEAASGVYERKGREASVEEIAAAAGLSVPVTYQFVKKPADIMLLILEDLQRRFADLAKTDLEGPADPQAKLMAVVDKYYRVVDQERSKVMLLYRASRQLDPEGRKRVMVLEMEAVAIFRRILEEGLAQGVFHLTDPDLTAYDILMMGHTWALKSWHFKRRGMSLENFVQAQQDLVLALVRG